MIVQISARSLLRSRDRDPDAVVKGFGDAHFVDAPVAGNLGDRQDSGGHQAVQRERRAALGNRTS